MADSGKRHILLVDDEIPNLSLFRKLFKSKYAVHTASSGPEGLKIMDGNPVDLVVCDQRMPGMTGVEFLEFVRASHPRTSRIILTAFLDLRAAIDAINLGQVSRYISKPWNNDELTALIDQEIRFLHYEEENERLAMAIQERNVQLERANLELESIDRIKTEFFSTVTHELKTPLLSSLGYLDLILSGRSGEVDPKQRKFLEKALQNIERFKDLVADLVDFSAYERGQKASVTTDFDFCALVAGEIDTIEIQARQKNLALSRTIPDGPLRVRGDFARISHAVANILGNAIKFTGQGGRIAATVCERDGHARLDVSDTGIGIPAEHIDRIFDRFYQVDSSTTRKFGGTGIGLAIVKTAMEIHKGRFGVESTPGRGSNFWISLPLAGPEAPVPADARRRFHRVVVGLIDPDPEALRRAQTMLIMEGLNVLSGETVDDALFISSSSSMDMLIASSAALATEGAAERIAGIRTAGRNLGVWLLGEPSDETRAGDLPPGIRGILRKPLRISDLLPLLMEKAEPAGVESPPQHL